jgi:hypothetical protein
MNQQELAGRNRCCVMPLEPKAKVHVEAIMAEGNVTTNHDEIRRWAEKRGGKPATVRDTEKDKAPGVLRLDFEPQDQSLEVIQWDDFFDKFDREKLAFLYQDKTEDGSVSRFHKFINRN